MTVPPLIGRDTETAWLRSLATAAASGHSSATVLVGDAGIGKTALLTAATEAMHHDTTVVAVGGVEAEIDLSFAALQRIVLRHRDVMESLTERHRSALAVATGLEEGLAGDRLAVGLGLLALLSALAETSPVFVWVDDAQWVDEDSLAAFAFVARRVLADRIAMVFVCRPDPDPSKHLAGISVRPLDGLSRDDASALLQEAVGATVERSVAERIADATGGNPLALWDLGSELTRSQLDGRGVLPDPVPVGMHLQDHYARQVRTLPPDTRRWLLLAATEPEGDIATIAAAASDVELAPSVSSAAERARLVTIAGRVRFRHPLIRSAVYGAATRDEQRTAHLDLARAALAQRDETRALLHRAAALDGTDAALAAELEAAAASAASRAHTSAQVRLLVLAATASPPPSRARRLLNAVQAAAWSGAIAQAYALLEEIDVADLDEPEQVLCELMVDNLQLTTLQPGAFAAQTTAFVRYARVLAVHGRREEALVSSSMAVRLSWLAGDAASDLEDSLAQFNLDLTSGDASGLAVQSLRAVSELVAGDPEVAVAAYLDAVQRCTAETVVGDEFLIGFAGVVQAAGIVADDVSRDRIMAALARAARQGAGDFVYANMLSFRTYFALHAGRLGTAQGMFDETTVLLQVVGYTEEYPPLVAMRAAIRGWTAEPPLAPAERDSQIAECRRLGYGSGVVQWQHAWLRDRIAAGDYAAAWDFAQELTLTATRADPFLIADLIEVADRVGEATPRDALRDSLLARTSLVDSASGRALQAWASAHSGGHDTEGLVTAIDEFDRADAPLYVARAHLTLGERLRRARRRTEALRHTEAAAKIFDREGAGAWFARTARELAPLGVEHLGTRSRFADLTAQEATVARLAAEGETNAVIAERLYVSPSTVDYHLRKVFRKLGVTSRRQLRAALEPRAGAPR